MMSELGAAGAVPLTAAVPVMAGHTRAGAGGAAVMRRRWWRAESAAVYRARLERGGRETALADP